MTPGSLESMVLQPAAEMAKQNTSAASEFRVQSCVLVITGILCLLDLPLPCNGAACIAVALPSFPDPYSQYNRHFLRDSAVKLEHFREKSIRSSVARKERTGHCSRMPGPCGNHRPSWGRYQRLAGLRPPRPPAFFLACSNSPLLIAPSPSLSAPFNRSAILSGNSSTPTLPSPFRSRRLNI